MSSKLKKHLRKAPLCRRCDTEFKGKNYMIYKEGFGWVCPRCGKEKQIPGWRGAAV